MNFSTQFSKELQAEASNTRKMLTSVPTSSLTWKPHEKSMSLGTLAGHIAELPSWVNLIINTDEIDFATTPYIAPSIESNENLITLFDSTLTKAIEGFNSVQDEEIYQKIWKIRNGEYLISESPRHEVIRTAVLNHIIHHRAQLSVYLRLLDIPIPGMYGPSADEM